MVSLEIKEQKYDATSESNFLSNVHYRADLQPKLPKPDRLLAQNFNFQTSFPQFPDNILIRRAVGHHQINRVQGAEAGH